MTGFLYFIPEKASADHSILVDAGITAMDGNETIAVRQVDSGPNNHPGVIIICQNQGSTLKTARHGFYRDDQQWIECESGQFWLGYEVAKKPSPDDLIRAQPIEGHQVDLGDDNQWLIPIARQFPNGTRLPQSIKCGVDGSMVFEAIEKYAGITADADLLFETFTQGADIDDAEFVRIAIDCLAINYRVSKYEASALSLLSTTNINQLTGALIDMPSIKAETEAQLKKNTVPDSGNSNAGVAA